jgi:beta-lactamase regulating signal transducer with metallopeptidase domain
MSAEFFIKRTNPVYKRNLLFILLATQVFLTGSTFFIYYSGDTFFVTEYIASNLSALLMQQPYLEQASPWLISAYTAVIIFKALQLIFNWRQFKVSSRSAWIKPPIDLRLFTTVKATEFGISRKVSLWYSNTVNTALTFGSLKPVILLPVALVNNLSIKETETLILHELTHIKNHDYFFNWLLLACETLFFFNPFIKIITARIRLEREKNCDTQVLQFDYPALNYAETLLKAARFKATPAPFLLAAVIRNAQLIKRIQFFTEEKNLRFYKRNYSMIAIVPVIAMCLLNIFFVNFIKHKDILQAAISPKEINTVIVPSYNENMNESFSTIILPVSTSDKITSASIIDQERAAATKINNAQLLQVNLGKLQANNRVQLQAALKMQELELEKLNEQVVLAENMVMPVALQPEISKEVTLTEESSATGKAVTKVYKMKLENGKWKTTLLWTITETRPASDSQPYLRDTTTRFYDQAQAQ